MADKEARIDDVKDDIRESDIANDDDKIRPRSRDEWIDGQQMMQIIAQEKAEEQRREEVEAFKQSRRISKTERPQQSLHTNNLASQVSYTDANTLEIDIPSPGIDSNAFVSGAFSALWFSAVIPATVGMLSAGFLPALLCLHFGWRVVW